ncbi:MAG: HD-GYP domain-containing protein [Halioglobus sp.]|nr:HD-GYP domain-containing protein [Halioglobus sp.]
MLQTHRVSTSDLHIGMYVSALDRPWLETPFITQGFLIETTEDIAKLQRYCQSVFVDSRRSREVHLAKPLQTVEGSARTRKVLQQKSSKAAPKERPRVPMEQIFRGRRLTPYSDDSKWEEEHPRAQQALNTLIFDIDDIFENVTTGDKLNVIKLRKSVEPVVDSISRNPDACLWVNRLKQHDQYTYQHSLSASMWSVSLGRQVGLPRQDLRSLAMGCLLMDVGKLRIDPALLRLDREFSTQEAAEMAGHIGHGLDILDECGVMNRDVIDMVAHHHERYDGSGYPNGMSGEDIPAFARIAAIVDTYDALTSNRMHAKAIAPSDAIKLLYNARDRDFQAELVEAFIQAIGIYPAGTLVELSSGEVGVVVAEYRTRRLRPKVMLLLDANKNKIARPQVVDLQEEPAQAGAPALTIKKSLQPQAYGIDLTHVSL